MLTEVRSYAVALWLYAKGHRPINAALTPGGHLVFLFPPEASEDIGAYATAKAVFGSLEAQAKAERA